MNSKKNSCRGNYLYEEIRYVPKYSNGNNTWKQHKHPFFDPSSSFDLGDLSEVDTISLKLISDCVTAELMHIVGAKLTRTSSFAQKVSYFLDVQKDNTPAIYNGFKSFFKLKMLLPTLLLQLFALKIKQYAWLELSLEFIKDLRHCRKVNGVLSILFNNILAEFIYLKIPVGILE